MEYSNNKSSYLVKVFLKKSDIFLYLLKCKEMGTDIYMEIQTLELYIYIYISYKVYCTNIGEYCIAQACNKPKNRT